MGIGVAILAFHSAGRTSRHSSRPISRFGQPEPNTLGQKMKCSPNDRSCRAFEINLLCSGQPGTNPREENRCCVVELFWLQRLPCC